MAIENQINTVGDLVEYVHVKKGIAVPYLKNYLGKVGNVSGLGGAINIMYGAVVYDQRNREANAHAILKKKGWDYSGFRIETTNPSTKLKGGADGSVTIMASTDMQPTEVSDFPAFLHTGWDTTMAAGVRSSFDDGLDVYAYLRAKNRDVHNEGLNEELLRSAEAEGTDIGAGGSSDPKNGGNNAKGLDSLDRHISSTAEADQFKVGTGNYDIYSGTGQRDSGTTYDAEVVKPDGTKTTYQTNQAFQLKGLDTLIDNTEANDADPASQMFLTGRSSIRALYDELGPAGRQNLETVGAKLTMQGLSATATRDGRDISFAVKTYHGRPFVADKNAPSNGTTDTSFPNGGTGLPHWYLLDGRYIDLQVAFPTIHIEADNPIYLNDLKTTSIYLTSEQLYTRRWGVHGKLRSQSA